MKRLQRYDERPQLTFAPLAWLKLQFFCHVGATEIGGFGISADEDLLYIEDFRTVRQETSVVTVRFDDQAVADLFDTCVDDGLKPAQFARIWIHTHPGESAQPSGTDADTFERSFGSCDWALMFIVSRTGETYARLNFTAGPRGHLLLPVQVDWSAWPQTVMDGHYFLDDHVEQWRQEFAANIWPAPALAPPTALANIQVGTAVASEPHYPDRQYEDLYEYERFF